MPALILPRGYRGRRAPRGRVELAWGNDLVQALDPVGIWVFCEPGGIPRNLVTGQACFRPSAAHIPTIAPGADGLGLYSPLASSGATTSAMWNSGLFPDATWRSLVGSFQWTATAPATSNSSLCGIHDSTRRFYLSAVSTTGTTKMLTGWGSSGADGAGSRPAPVAHDTETIGLTAQGFGTSGVQMDRYLNGDLIESITGISWTGSSSSRNFYIGKRTNANATEDGKVDAGPACLTYWVAACREPLTAEIHKELHYAPWQMVQKHAERIYFFPAPAAGSIAASGGATAGGSATATATASAAATGGTTAGGSANLTGGTPGDIAATGGTTAGGSATLGATVGAAASGGTTAGGSATLSAAGTVTIVNTADRGTIDAAASSVVPNGSTPTINILSRYFYEENIGGPRYFFFHVTGVDGLTPVFDISQDLNTPAQISYTGKFWFSYTGDLDDWTQFANTTDLSSPNVYRVSHSSAFTGDTVYVSMHPPWRVGYTLPWIHSLESSGYVAMPPSSAGNDYLFGTRTATKNGSPGDIGDPIAAQPLYSFKVSNGNALAPDGSAKKKMVLFGGVHASEDVGNYALRGAIEFLISADAKAAQVRTWFDVYVYPVVASAGRAGGGGRGDFEATHKSYDVNRHWDEATMETIVKHKAAITSDVGANIDVFLDFHGDYTRETVFAYFYRTGEAKNSAWDAAIKVYHPTIAETANTATGYAQFYAIDDLAAEWSFVMESPFKGTFTKATIEGYGANNMRAIADLIAVGEFGTVGGLQASGGTTAGGSADLSSSGGPAGDIAASGGAAAGGSATAKATASAAAAGGAAAGGSANLSGAATGSIAASGGTQAGGSAALTDTTEGHVAASGGTMAGGSAAVIGTTALVQEDFLVTSMRAFRVTQQFGVTNDRFPNKFAEERLVLGFDLADELADDETLTAVSATSITVLQGSDPAPHGLLYGSPQIVGGSKVLQAVQAGVAGVDYQVKHVCITSNPAKVLAIVGNIYVE